jgi:hypothetical protein
MKQEVRTILYNRSIAFEGALWGAFRSSVVVTQAPASGGETATKFTEAEREKLFEQLEVPFDPALIKWRVMRTYDNGRSGVILPIAYPRACTYRLNELFMPQDGPASSRSQPPDLQHASVMNCPP